MTNKEKFAKEILEIACSGDSIAVIKKSGRIVPCDANRCSLCLFRGCDCKENTKEWAESEYVEKPVISKRDRAFLEYIREEYKFAARDKNGKLFVYNSKPYKNRDFIWYDGGLLRSSYHLYYNVDFPMIKWEDSEPWKIEDLKKLKVVDEYEK